MFVAPESKYLVPFDGSFRVARAPTGPGKGQWNDKRRLKRAIRELDGLQKALYAADRYAMLLVFQAMDGGGKDGTIRAVMDGINPAGCQVFSFKKPTSRDLDHDFLWRPYLSLPERGRIGIFNRSHYEEVLVVRVHPEILNTQKLPDPVDLDTLWEARFASIRNFEEHLARNGTIIVKFWLNVSRAEQKARFLARLDEPDKQWKFNIRDVREREFWDAYMSAYEDALNASSRPWAPWYAIPADDKPYARACVAEIIAAALASVGLEYPHASADDIATFDAAREMLARQ